MSDLESRLTEVLRAEAEDAPSAVGLAGAARARARARRRTTVMAVGAVAVAALAVPVAVVALGGPDGDGATVDVADESSPPPPEPPAGGRVETWHDVSVTVPETWVNASAGDWCANDGQTLPPRVSRPGGLTLSIGCTPASTYGVQFSDFPPDSDIGVIDWPVAGQSGGMAWPEGAYVGVRSIGDVVVTVATEDAEEARTILDSMRKVEDVDANGCSAADDGGPGLAESGVVPVCRYDENKVLVQSERLSGEDATSATAVSQSLTVATSGRTCQSGPTEYVVMGIEGQRVEVQWAGNAACIDRGVFVEGVRHELTADVLYWALSPGWTGEIPNGTPFPPELR